MNFLKKALLIGLMLAAPLLSPAQSATFQWDHSLDASAINPVKYYFYGRTNGIASTNYTRLATNTYPGNTVTLSVAAGVSQSFYVTAEDTKNLIESDPSNIVDYFSPIGVPPANLLTSKSIDSYNPVTKVWSNVRFSWAPVDFNKYGLTNYLVVPESGTATNKVTTTATSFTISSLVRADYKFYVLTSNALGTSPLDAGTVWF